MYIFHINSKYLDGYLDDLNRDIKNYDDNEYLMVVLVTGILTKHFSDTCLN